MARIGFRLHRDHPGLTAAVVLAQLALAWLITWRPFWVQALRLSSATPLRVAFVSALVVVSAGVAAAGFAWLAFRSLRWVRSRTASNLLAVVATGGATYYAVTQVLPIWFAIIDRWLRTPVVG